MSFQQIVSKSPLKIQQQNTGYLDESKQYSKNIQHYNSLQPTQQPLIHNEQSKFQKQKYIEYEKIIENQQLQINEMKQFISDCQISLAHFKKQLDDQLTINENNDREVRSLNQLILSLKQENQQLIILYNEKKKEFEQFNAKNQQLIEEINNQYENALKIQIENDLKEIHIKYLREIQWLKVKLSEFDTKVQENAQLQIKCEELLQGIDQKNNYIDDLLLKYGELDEKYEQLKRQISQKLYEEEIFEEMQKFKPKFG